MKDIINKKNTNYVLWASLFVLFSSTHILPMRMSERGKASAKRYLGIAQKEEAIKRKRDLLIFLDDSETGQGLGFTGSHLVMAIGQKVSPIIVSTHVFNNIINDKTQYYFTKVFFQANEWIIKKVNNSLYLLIPINYLKTLKIDADKVKAFDGTMGMDAVSDVELQLGLKVNHMENIEYQSMNQLMYEIKQFMGYAHIPFLQKAAPIFADYFIDSLDNIFCKRLDYQNRAINIPEWIIYLAGHGDLLYSIAYISLGSFKKLLHFLDTNINTSLLVIFSCYAAGMNVNKVYGDMKLGTQEYYSYPIIINALNDTFVATPSPEINIKGLFYKRVGLIIPIDFISFFKKAKELQGNYSEIIRPIAINFVENTPQIKLPGMEWFSVIDMADTVVSIGATLVKTRDPQKPLDVASFFKKDPDTILLYTDNIPFELIINSSKMKYIVSMVSPQIIEEDNKAKEVGVYTRIKKISSTHNFSDILYWFKPVVLSDYTYKYFFIDEIGDKQGIIIFRTKDGGMRIYYKDKNDVLFTVKLEKKQLQESKEIIFEKIDKGSEFEGYYKFWRDEYFNLAEEREKEKKGFDKEIEKIKDVQQKKIEAQKALK